jgi:hypothetical protein
LGTLGPALLKLLAIAILPGAIAGILGHVTFGLANWGITLLCYYCLLYYLFELDASEMRITTAIIWGMRFVSRLIIIAFAASFLGGVNSGRVRQIGTLNSYANPASGTSSLGNGVVSPPGGFAGTDRQAAVTISIGNAVEALEWCKPEETKHMGRVVPKSTMLSVAKSFYTAGARKVWAANPSLERGQEFCGEFIVEMPDDTAARKNVLMVKAAFEKQPTPMPDKGNHFLTIMLNSYQEY